jgi:Ca2+-binding RTX toxin-like protein
MAILYAEDGTNKDDTIIGSANDDVINAGNGNDLVFGNAGNDRLLGGNGSDRVFGGSGSDIIGTLNADATLRNAGSGDNGGDTLYGDGFENWDQYKNAVGGAGNTASVTTATSSDVIYGGNGKDTIWGDNGNNATGTGAGGADIIYAGNGVDTVYGEGGNDVLVGENGADVLYGGSGSDFFVYNAVNESSGTGYDTIKDFSEFKDANTTDNDKIDLRPLLAGGFGQVAGGSYNSDNSDATDAAKLNWGGMNPIEKGVWFKHVDTNGDSIADTTMVYADTDGNLLTGTDGGAELVIKLAP